MERLMATGTIGSITVAQREVTRPDGTKETFTVGTLRFCAKTRKKSRSSAGWEDIDTWYEIEASGKEPESWHRFSKGDGIVVTGIPFYQPFIKQDGTPWVQVYLQDIRDLSWTRGSSLRNQNGNGAQQGYGDHADERQVAQVPVNPADDEIF